MNRTQKKSIQTNRIEPKRWDEWTIVYIIGQPFSVVLTMNVRSSQSTMEKSETHFHIETREIYSQSIHYGRLNGGESEKKKNETKRSDAMQ